MFKANYTDITGQKFERLTAIERVPNKNGRTRWLCLCDCGNKKEVRSEHLTNLKIRSCGCLDMDRMTTHGMSRSREYSSYQAMKGRCQNPKCSEYKYYGGRGIKICDRWLESFENFFADMGIRPARTSLDRKNNEGNYTPDNCRWATDIEQVYNRRNNRNATINGITKPVKQWCAELKIVVYQTALKRIWRGMSNEDAVLKPSHIHKVIAAL